MQFVKLKFKLSLLLFLCFLSISGKSVKMNGTQEILNLKAYEEVAYSSKEQSISEFVRDYTLSENADQSYQLGSTIKWVKYDFENTHNDSIKKFIYLPYHNIYKIDVYLKTDSVYKVIAQTGTARHHELKDLEARGYPVKIELPAGNSSIIFRFDNKKIPIRTSAFLMSNKQVKVVLFKTMHKIWFWRGIFFVALLFSLVLFVSSKNKLFVYYFLFNIGVALTIGSEIGDFMHILGADINGRSLDFKLLGNVFILLFFPLFLDTYTPLKNIYPKLWKAMYAGTYFAILLMVLSCFTWVKGSNGFLFIFFYFFLYTPAVLFLLVLLLLKATLKKQRSALELLIVYGTYVFFVTLGVVLPTFNMKSDGIYVNNFIIYTSIGEILAFLFLIGARVMKLFRHNTELLEKQKTHQQEIIKAVVESQEIERNKIGQEIHDLLGASIAMVRNNVSPDNKPIIKLIDDTIVSIKTVSNGLMTPRVMNGDFEEEIKNLCALSSGEEMHVQHYFHNWPHLTNGEISTHLYRIIQELLHNAIQHSNATKVYVQFLKRHSDLCVIYEDNGKGLVYSESRKMGRGIIGIENRVQLINGELHIDSGVKEGLSVLIELKNHTP